MLFLGIVLGVITASCALGWLLNRLRLFPDTTPIRGLLPGAASVMMVMADDFGADGRFAAFMQYLRVVFVALAAALVARFVHASATITSSPWFSAVHWAAFLETLVFIVISVILGRKSGIRGGGILVPLVLGAVLNISGVLPLELPRWFLAFNYALLGWNIGLRFSRKILCHAARALPQTILSVALLMGFCWGLAWVLVSADGIDPLTAYLATSPGGLDAAAIIAASCKVDMPFVVSMQAARLCVVLMIGPIVSRWFTGWVRTERPIKHPSPSAVP